jgi:acyl-coenzyme A synthetase/AMP-(fatty) acid ligase
MTPYLLAEQLSKLPEIAKRRDDVRLIVGGASLPRALARRVFAEVTDKLCILIASTETGPWSLTPAEGPGDILWRRIHPSRTVEIVDENGRPTPVGDVGQVRVRVIDGAQGYLGDEAASRAHFRDGWFYPGDLALAAPDGRIALQGRITDVIHVDGVKRATGPIEGAMAERLGVDEVCVLSAPDADLEEALHVFVQTRKAISVEALRQAAMAELPWFSAVRFHRLEALPRTPSGKVMRAALRAMTASA